MFDVLLRITEGRIRRPREVDRSINGELEALLLTALAQNPDDTTAKEVEILDTALEWQCFRCQVLGVARRYKQNRRAV